MLHERLPRLFTARVIIWTNVTWFGILTDNLSLALVTVWACPGVGLTSPEEFYAAAIIYGLNGGSLQSFSRGLLSAMTPSSYEAQFFSVYEFVNKGTSWLGPLIVGWVADATGSIRWAVRCFSNSFLSRPSQ